MQERELVTIESIKQWDPKSVRTTIGMNESGLQVIFKVWENDTIPKVFDRHGFINYPTFLAAKRVFYMGHSPDLLDDPSLHLLRDEIEELTPESIKTAQVA